MRAWSVANKERLMRALAALSVVCVASAAWAQTPASVIYRADLVDNGQPAANGTYQMAFDLYDAPVGGNLVGSLAARPVMVTAGSFSEDIGPLFPPGTTEAWLAVTVQPPASGAFDTLARVRVSATPYAVRAAYADSVDWAGVMNAPVPLQGATGPAGPVGATGVQGLTGNIGVTGPVGATGPQGPMGATGVAGAVGPAGAAGATGPQGPMGATGVAGAVGPAGATGVTGAQGPVGATGVAGAAGAVGATGATGPAGPQGADGQRRIYGDGSAGTLVITANTNWSTAPPASTLFDSIRVVSGATLTVPSGTVIRCTGTFTVESGAAVTVTGGAGGGNIYQADIDPTRTLSSLPEPGVSIRPAINGLFGPFTGALMDRAGGGTGLLQFQAAFVRHPGVKAGGGGGIAAAQNLNRFGAAGGGSLVVLAQGNIQIIGTVNADGTPPSYAGAGGAGGGIVILGSASLVVGTSTAIINANGADGRGGSGTTAGGGGGGGGIIHLIAPVVNYLGAANVAGGAGGGAGGTASAGNFATGGGGGGACGGNGGGGGHVATNGTTGSGFGGGLGYYLVSTEDPAFSF